MLININKNFFVGLLIQLIQINLLKAGLLQVKDGPKVPQPKFQRSEASRNYCHFSI